MRILAAIVDDNAALDGRVVGVKDVHFACAASEAISRIVDRFLLRVGRRERWLDAGSLECDSGPVEFITWSDLDDRHPLVLGQRGPQRFQVLRHHTRSRNLCPKLAAHLLDLCGLRFEG